MRVKQAATAQRPRHRSKKVVGWKRVLCVVCFLELTRARAKWVWWSKLPTTPAATPKHAAALTLRKSSKPEATFRVYHYAYYPYTRNPTTTNQPRLLLYATCVWVGCGPHLCRFARNRPLRPIVPYFPLVCPEGATKPHRRVQHNKLGMEKARLGRAPEVWLLPLSPLS